MMVSWAGSLVKPLGDEWFRPREPSPPGASHAFLSVQDRRVLLRPVLPLGSDAGGPPTSWHPPTKAERQLPGPVGPAHLRCGHTCVQLAAGFGVGATTTYRYIAEAVNALAALAPDLAAAVRTAAHKAFVILAGTLPPIGLGVVQLGRATGVLTPP
ncbi:transposase family protein [Streptomyces globisporus]|uniref:Transposase family protein n=1 Tax=Streptomyces globisporus TaxID=1908 RepID=A0A423UXH6_STRGL|nr:transposase family protein [Streptomyces globisporus]